MVPTISPCMVFLDKNGDPLTGGKIYFGVANENPETSPLTVYWDIAGTQPAAQPIATLNGYPVRNGTPAQIFTDSDHSLTVRDSNAALVFYSAKQTQTYAANLVTADDGSSGSLFTTVQGFITKAQSSSGSSLFGFQQGGTLLRTTTIQEKLSRLTVSPEDDYANSTPGVTDMTAATNNAIAYCYANGGGIVTTDKKLLIGSSILMLPGVHLRINNELACTGMTAPGANETANSAVLFKGTSVSTSVLTVAGAEGDVSVTVASVVGLAAGDDVIIEDNYNFGRGIIDGVNSHAAQILSIAGNVVTLDNPLPTAFPLFTSQLRKVTLVTDSSVRINRISGAPYQGVAFMWARGCVAYNTTMDKIGKNAIYFHSSYGCIGSNIKARNPNSVISPYGYGAEFDFGAADNILENSYFEGIREISIAECARRNIVRTTRIIRPIDSGINTHGLGAMDNLFESNYIFYPAQYGIAIGQAATSGKAIDIRTTVRGNTVMYAQGYAFREVQFSDGTSTPAGTVFEDNTAYKCATDSYYIGGANVATDMTNTTLRRNRALYSGGNGYVLDTVSVNEAILDGNQSDRATTAGVLLNGCGEGIHVRNQVITNSGTYGIRNFAEGPRILLGNNDVSGSGTADYLNVGIQAPLVGTWQVGDKMPNAGNVSAGANVGWICTTKGTLGTLNSGSTTGGITINTNTLVVNSATGLKLGQYITIVGVTGVKRITALSGTTVTIDTNADATVAAAAVAFSNAVFKSTGTIAA